MNHVDLCSGIGGFALGLHGADFRTVVFCEIDPFCQQVLKRHWPDVEIIDDLNAWISMPRFVSSGQAPNGGAQWARVRPDWIVAENTYHRWRSWVPELRRRLYQRGYASLPIRVRACEVGALHIRSRCFLVAYADSERLRQFKRWWCWQGWSLASEFATTRDWTPGTVGEVNGISHRLDRLRCLGNAIVPQIAEIIGKGISATT